MRFLNLLSQFLRVFLPTLSRNGYLEMYMIGPEQSVSFFNFI